MAEQRKATEVLLEVERLIKGFSGYIQNIDNNTKLILDRLNRLEKQGAPVAMEAPVTPTVAPPSPAQVTSPDVPAPPSNVQKVGKVLVAKPVEEQPFELDEHGQPELQEEVIHKGQRRTDRARPTGLNKRISVSQQILFEDGKAVFVAGVEIFDRQGLLVKQARTNSQGRWIAALEPGEYTIHVLKRMSADKSKRPVEMHYQVQIPESSTPLELPMQELPAAR